MTPSKVGHLTPGSQLATVPTSGAFVCNVVHYAYHPGGAGMKNPDRKSRRTSVMLPESAIERVQALADANNVSSAWVIRLAVERFLESQQGQRELPLQFVREEQA